MTQKEVPMPRWPADKNKIQQSLRYLDSIKTYIDELPAHARGIASYAAAEVLLEAVKFYPVYQFYGRAEAYPDAHLKYPERWIYIGPKGQLKMHKPIPGYFSLKQFRKVMALKSKYDFGYPHRTGKIKRAWRIERSETKSLVANDSPGVKWVMGNKTQATQPRGAGWERVHEIAVRIKPKMIEAMKKAIKEKYPRRRRSRSSINSV